ncbi:MAG TPA: hypothetical protein VHZ52_18830 [Acidobacteriaceae bacterium]|nr:hypothetical protein [Acidobacteriaceae bacterium]
MKIAVRPPRQQVWQRAISHCSDADLRSLLSVALRRFAKDQRWRSHVISAQQALMERHIDD